MKRIYQRTKYVAIAVSALASLHLLAHRKSLVVNPIDKQMLIKQDDLNKRFWRNFIRRHDVVLALTWVFVTSGTTTILPADFNIASNTIHAIGTGVGGLAGVAGSCCVTADGGRGGGGGAYANISNYSAHTGGQTVSVGGFASDVFFDSVAVLKAAGASGQTGGLVANCVGTVKNAGGSGGAGAVGTPNPGGGGGGGGSGGPNGAGSTGGAGSNLVGSPGGDGGNADSGHTTGGAHGNPGSPGGSGNQFDASHGSGAGGGGGDGAPAIGAGHDAGSGGNYGGGGGGGGGGVQPATGGNPGSGVQGIIAISYTPANKVYSFSMPMMGM